MGKSDKFILSDGSVELLKWVAVCLMVVDHVNKYLFGEAYPVMFSFGRLVLPIFVVVLAYNLARENSLRNGVYFRAITRMVIFGLLATPAFVGLGGDLALVKDGQELWWILNIWFCRKHRLIVGFLSHLWVNSDIIPPLFPNVHKIKS